MQEEIKKSAWEDGMKGIECIELRKFITEYKQKNEKNEFKPVAVGKYGIRTRESIYSKELAKDYSKNKIIFKNTLTVGMGSRQIDIGILTDDVIYSVSPAYHTYKISGINADYLRYCLMCRNEDMFKRFVKRGSRQGKSIDLKRWLEYEIPVYDVCNQEKIVLKLNKVTNVISMRKQQLQKLDELIQARFVEMFGDPVLNEKGWRRKPLLDMGNCKNGMNFHYDDCGVEINCLGVGDFKDLSIIDNTEQLPTVSLKEMPSEEYLLKDDDVVFVRSNGNKTLVGRSVAVYPGEVATTFSGFCIRYRKYDEEIRIPYLLRVLKTDSIRRKMTGRGANIQNLNQQILSNLLIPVPPIELQNQFAGFVNQVNKSKVEIQQALEKTQLLFDSLMQQYFG